MTGWPWRLEWQRLNRTFRLLAAAAFFVTFGMTSPFMALYANEIIAGTGTALARPASVPTPAMSVETFTDNSVGLGVFLIVVLATGTLALDSRPALAIFYRSRVRSAAALILPRYVTVTFGMAVAYSLGAWITWYETAVLIAMPSPQAMAQGNALVVVYVAFAVAVVALVATFVRGVLAVIGISTLALLTLPVLALVPGLGGWVPSALLASQHVLLRPASSATYGPALAVTLAATAACLFLACRRTAAREL
ncbi:hypothetical protein ABZ897_38605 [Nonomuraea sp. NPDC046802]|uniref:hypothetical protein n=1 Tax=Nonomuraea sp. NPDC046802 TaxID=3154919 RepID=UPI0034103563